MANQLLMSIDIGTTSTKCLVINKEGDVKALSSQAYSIINKRKNWLEQNPLDWWRAVRIAIKECLELVSAKNISGISFSGQMSAPVLINEKGKPVCSSILISDTRSSKQSKFLHEYYLNEIINITGNKPIDAFTASKLLWIKENEIDTMNESTAFMFSKDFIRYKLTNKIGVDPTDAGNSLLYDASNKKWNWDLMDNLCLPRHIFPNIYDSCNLFGGVSEKAAIETGLLEGTPVITGAADMACSQIGSGAIHEGVLSITLSTSGQIVSKIQSIQECGIGKVTFHNSVLNDSLYTMGTLFTGGLGVEWGYKLLHNKTNMTPEDYEELDTLTREMAQYSPGSNGLMFLPFLVGSATPYFDSMDKGAWIGLELNQSKSLMLHSILEGISFNIKESVKLIKEMGLSIDIIHIGAGGSKNEVWCRIIADMLGADVLQLENRDCSALGAAIIAGVGIGLYESIESGVQLIVKEKRRIQFDESNKKKYNKLFKEYTYLYKSVNQYYHK